MGADWPGQVVAGLVASIYRAPLEQGLWSQVMGTIAGWIGASVAGIHVHSGEAREARTVGLHGAAPSLVAQYESHFAARNVWLTERAHLLKLGAVLTGEDLCSDEIFLRSEFYNDFLRPHGLRYSIRAVIGLEPLAYLFALRPPTRPAFGPVERKRLLRVAPHLAQAMRIQAQLEVTQSHRRAATEAMDRLPLGVFLLDGRGRVVEMNAAARKIVEGRDGLALDRGVLVARETRADVQLQRMIFGAAAAATGRNLTLGGACILPRTGDAHPLSAMIAPTGVTGIFPASRAASVVVLVEEPARRDAVPFDQFSARFGLSRAEASLAARLVAGLSLRQAAESLGIRENTARSHLKRVFAKTGAKRQSDLMRRALTHEPAER